MAKKIFTAGVINATPFNNRAIVAPMTRISASETGVPGEIVQRYYASLRAAASAA